MKRSRTEKSPWIKNKTKPGLNMNKIDEFYPSEGKISLKVTRARGSINSQKGKQLMLHLWMNQQSVRKKEEEESNVTRERLPKTSPDYSSSSDFSLYETNASLHFWNYAAAPSPWFGLVLWKYVFSFRFVLCWPRLKREPPWTCAELAPWFVFVPTKNVVSFFS